MNNNHIPGGIKNSAIRFRMAQVADQVSIVF